MKKVNKNSAENKQEKIIEQALKTGGFLFPETIDEVKEFERIYGTTEIILPPGLEEPTFLDSKKVNVSKEKKVATTNENFALAAREGSNKLPDQIINRMSEDRKKASVKRKNK